MVNTKKFKLKRINKTILKIPRFLAERAFLVFWILLLLSLSLSAFVFYQYSYLIKKTEIKAPQNSILFKEDSYNTVLKAWQDQEQRFSEVDLKQYLNPF